MTKKSVSIAGIAFTTVLALSGCVTKSAYEQLEAEKNQQISRLQADRDAVQRQRDDLQKQVDALDAQRSALEIQKASLEQDQVALQTRVGLLAQERTSLEQQQADLKKQIDALEKQKQQLLAASAQTQSQYDALVRSLKDEVKKGELQVRQYKNMLTVDVAEQLFFDSGEASLKASGKEVLKKVGESLKSYDDKLIRVIGHTDNVPIAKSKQKIYPSNWELSVARATTVVRYLQEVGVPPERMMAAGRAEYAPVTSNDTADGRKKNRRIEITLVDRNLETVQAAKE